MSGEATTHSPSEGPEHVAVVGGGAVGTTAAYDLARAGVVVTLFEAGTVASGSSGRAAGIMYAAFADRRDAVIGKRSIERFESFDGEGAFSFVRTPYVWLARDGDGTRAGLIREQVDRIGTHDVPVSLAGPDDLAERWPALHTEDVDVAGVCELAGRTEPGTYPELLAAKATREGATVIESTPVELAADDPTTLVGPGGERQSFDAVALATGAHTKRVLAGAGVPIALKPYRVQALVSPDRPPRSDDGSDPPVPMVYDATGGFYCKPRGGGLLAGDGTETVEADPDDWHRAGDDWFVEDLRTDLAHRLDMDPPAVGRAWAGLCAATPDRNPLFGELRAGLFVACGWQGHGFMRAPALGEHLAGMVRGCEDATIPAFDPTRFSGEEAFEIVEGMAVEER